MPYKTFLTNKLNSAKFRVNGLIPSSRLPNKIQLCQAFHDHILYQAEQLPPKVDLRSDMTPVEDQSQIGSCAANCLAGAYEYLTKKSIGRNTDVSRLFIYYNARVKDQKSEKIADSGCTMTSAIEALEEFGTCLESVWPYDISRVNSRPNDQSYDEAKRHKITEALRVNINLHEMKACLAQGFPFAFGIRLYTSFDQAAKTGVVPMPDMRDNGRQSHASHAMLAVGYSDQSKAFIVRNSWGEHWGDQGYCYIPYEYLTNPNFSFDVWTVRKLAADSFGQDHWDIDDTVNYARVKKNDRLNAILEDDNRVIEAYNDDDDDNDDDYYAGDQNGYKRNGSFNQPWNPYPANNGYNYPTDDDGFGYSNINQSGGYKPNDNFNGPWNPYGGNNYSRKDFANDYVNINRNDDYKWQNKFDNPWNSYGAYGGYNFSRYDDDDDNDRYRSPFGGNAPYSSYNQFQGNDNSFGFRGGFPGFDQPINNGPNMPPFNQFTPPSLYNGYQPYGLNYGYTSAYDNFYNPYF